MFLLDRLSPARQRYRAVWSDPARKRRTLELFARTEADGARDVAAAARKATDEWLRDHLERHAKDEARHAAMFRERAAALAAGDPGGALATGDLGRAFDVDANRTDLNAHGFLDAGQYEDLGEVAYLAMLHVAEKRAAALFGLHESLLGDDPETRELFASILKDEAYHVAYTGQALERWRTAGRGREVKAALEAAKGARFLGAMKRAGARAATGLGRVILLVLQVTLLLPAAWVARRALPAGGWRAAEPGATDEPERGVRSQA